MRSAILRALAMSWVIETAVAPRSLTHLTIRSLMTSAMIGSRPVVGSSKKMISGSAAMARASADALLHAAGELRRAQLADLGPEPDLRRACRSPPRAPASRAMPSPWIRPKATFSQTRSESNSAPPWNSMPNLRMTRRALAVAEADRLLAVDLDRAAVGPHEAEDAFEQHRLAGAGAADHHQRFARRDSRSRPLQHLLRPEGLFDAAQRDLRQAARSSREERLR